MSVQTSQYTSKKTGKTTIRYFASVWDAEEGKSIVGPKRGKKKEAQADEVDIRRQLEAGKKPMKKTKGETIDCIAMKWLDASRPPVFADSTWRIYSEYYGRYIKNTFGDVPVNKVTALNVQSYVNIIKDKLGAETVNKCITILKDIFDFAIDPLKQIVNNPVIGIKRMKVGKKQVTTWKDDEIQYFLSLPDVKDSHYYPLFCISLILGARPGEICGLKNEYLHDSPMFLRLDSGLNRYGVSTTMKNDGSHRDIPIPESLYQVIRAHVDWKQNYQKDHPGFADHEYLFVNLAGTPIKPDKYSKAFKRLLTAHNTQMHNYINRHGCLPSGGRLLRDISLYDCRHCFATNALDKKYDVALISSIMGNTPKTLLSRYAHPDHEQQLTLISEAMTNALCR